MTLRDPLEGERSIREVGSARTDRFHHGGESIVYASIGSVYLYFE